MSTIPHDPGRAVGTVPATAILQPVSYEQKVANAVNEFEAAALWLGISRAPTSELRDLCRKVAEYTADLFSDGFAIKVKNDPEIPDDLYFVFEVCLDESVDKLVAMNDEWHRRLLLVPGRPSGLFRLSICCR